MADWYNWRDDLYTVSGALSSPENQLDLTQDQLDVLIWKAAELICEKESPSTRDIEEACLEFINGGSMTLWAIHQASRLYSTLIKWYGSENSIYENARNAFLADDCMYFVTGCGYDVMSADLLGGTAAGSAAREFDAFVEQDSAESI